MNTHFVPPLDMQQTLFSELSSMFGNEVPLYDKSLAVNFQCNRAVADLLESVFAGFSLTDEQIVSTSRERHGAIRIGREDEFHWITRYFACFGMEPHNFYDMTNLGRKSQPVIATAFRSRIDPKNRVFTSLLCPDYFDEDTAREIRSLLGSRLVLSDEARALIERHEEDGGLRFQDAHALIAEGTQRIFKWTGEARNRRLYTSLCDRGFKIAADIACFSSHHLNHLTPNTLCIDLYSDAMKWRLGLIDRSSFLERVEHWFAYIASTVDTDWLLLHFTHLHHADVAAFEKRDIPRTLRRELIARFTNALEVEALDLASLNHNGYKHETEGPAVGAQILLRQDAYRALTERIRFIDESPHVEMDHTARFGEIEQRFYATTPKGRALYDACMQSDHRDSSESGKGRFESFPSRLREMIERELVYAVFEPGERMDACEAEIDSLSVMDLVRDGVLLCRGMRYEDFLPLSAAGIFASNLEQYGTDSTAEERPNFERAHLEAIMGRPIVDSDAVYRSLQRESLHASLRTLGVTDLIDD